MKQHKIQAYSLIELLLVLIVLGILTAIFLPVFMQARNTSRRVACSSSMRQLGIAVSLYSSDYNGSYPPATTSLFNRTNHAKAEQLWPDLLKPYTGRTVLACPSRTTWSTYKGRTIETVTCGYAYNAYLSQSAKLANGYTMEGRTDTRIKLPASVVLFCDVRAGILTTSRPDTNANFAHSALLYPNVMESDIKAAPPGATRHIGGANYVFVDGHVRWLKPLALTLGPSCDGSAPCFGL